jgi:hypothetical protein
MYKEKLFRIAKDILSENGIEFDEILEVNFEKEYSDNSVTEIGGTLIRVKYSCIRKFEKLKNDQEQGKKGFLNMFKKHSDKMKNVFEYEIPNENILEYLLEHINIPKKFDCKTDCPEYTPEYNHICDNCNKNI